MKWNFLLLSILIAFHSFAQTLTQTNTVTRPKLVVGIVIDQMRWDYLYRYNDIFSAIGGFKRLLNNGFSCENTMIPYTPTVTAAGHTCIYTGSVPSIHGIAGNDWYNKYTNEEVYCTDDNTVHIIGQGNANAGKMSPRNLLTTTITDELRLATNFKSKVIGIAIKDRGAILPAGHAANAAYWYDYNSGNFITSSYYKMTELPQWVQSFNNRKIVDSFYRLNWNLFLPASVYEKYASADDEPYERQIYRAGTKTFPHKLDLFAGKDYGKILYTPWGNNLTLEMAKSAVINEQLGKSSITDFLALSLSSPDYIGHSFGPNSWEEVDNYARLDAELGKFFTFLDAQVGKGNYTIFLTADHGVAHIPGYLQQHNIPAGTFNDTTAVSNINNIIKNKTGVDSVVFGIYNYQLCFNHQLIEKNNLDENKLCQLSIAYLIKDSAVSQAFTLSNIMIQPMNNVQRQMFANGYNQQRSGDVQFILNPGYIDGGSTGTTHGLWNPYDAHIPLLWYGWGIKHGKMNNETYMTDISATLAALLHIQMPSGCVGKVITEVMK